MPTLARVEHGKAPQPKAPHNGAPGQPVQLGGPPASPATARRGATGLVPSVIDPDVLWSCTTCGACVEECPVDIEHIDAIVDMRRYEVLMESGFPTEAGLLLRNLENQGDPWGLGASKRTDWLAELDFEVPVVGDTIPDDVEYLYWVGARARSTSAAASRWSRRLGCSTVRG